MKIWGERLKQARLDANLGHEALATAVGANSRQQVYGWEKRGSAPRDMQVFANVCDVLGVSADWLLGREDQKRPDYGHLSPRYIRAMQRVAALPKPLQDNLLGLIEQLEPLQADSLVGQLLSYDTQTVNHAQLMEDIRSWQDRHHQTLRRTK